jgi:hypothetical protein
MELAINPQKHALGGRFCQRYFKCDSEYSYCRMSKLFILPAALKTARFRSLLVAYFPWRPLDRTEKTATSDEEELPLDVAGFMSAAWQHGS